MYLETSVTCIPLSANNFAVPPVDKISTPFCAKLRAKSTIPVLSETLNKARLIGRGVSIALLLTLKLV